MGQNASAQAVPTARKGLDVAFFGGPSLVYTGLNGGRNLSITAGVDVTFRQLYGLSPSVEVRGMTPIDHGEVAGEKTLMGGLKVSKRYARFHPYVDVLFGRGQLDYAHGGLLNPQRTLLYTQTASNTYGAGGGVDFELTQHFMLKADGQFEHFSTPAAQSGSISSFPITGAVVYRFNFGLGHGRTR